MAQPEIKRTAAECQRYHDILVGIILEEPPLAGWEAKATIVSYAECLCWILGHDHNTTFGDNMANMERELERLGVQILDAGELLPPMKEDAD